MGDANRRDLSVEAMTCHSRVELAIRLPFIAAGFGVACWALLVPYAKASCVVGGRAPCLALCSVRCGYMVLPLGYETVFGNHRH